VTSNWNVTGSWIGGVLPANSATQDDAVISSTTTATTITSTTSRSIKSVTVGTAGTWILGSALTQTIGAGGVTVNAGGLVTQTGAVTATGAGGALTITGGTYTQGTAGAGAAAAYSALSMTGGTYNQNSTADFGNITVANAALNNLTGTLKGTGSLNVNTGGVITSTKALEIGGAANINGDATLAVGGIFNANSGAAVKTGGLLTVNGNATAGGLLAVATGGKVTANAGVSVTNGVFQGKVTVASGSALDAAGYTNDGKTVVSGGPLTVTGSNNYTNSSHGTTTVNSGGSVLVGGSTNNVGTIDVKSGGSYNNTSTTGTTTTNSGTITNAGSYNSGGDTTNTKTITNTGTFSTGGNLTNGDGTVANAGTITTSNSFTTTGNLSNTEHSTFTVSGGTATSGTTSNAGTLNVNGGSYSDNGTTNSGAVTVASGASYATNSLVNTSGTFEVKAGATSFTTSSIDVQGGTVTLSHAQPTVVNTLNISAAGSAGNLVLTDPLNRVVVNNDYTNSGFVVGSGFNARAGVTGDGAIVSGDLVDSGQANQGLSVNGGTVTNLDTSIALGNVHTTTSISNNGLIGNTSDVSSNTYQIANTGDNTTIRGTVDATGATDTRITGYTGVHSAISVDAEAETNYLADGLVGKGGADPTLSSNVTLQFHGDSVGELSGQSVVVKDNFGEQQTLSITGGTAYDLATPNAHDSPVVVTNQHVGNNNADIGVVKVAQAITVSNSADASYGEKLIADLSTVPPTLTAAVVSGGPVTVNAGDPDNTSLKVGVNTETAGAKGGNVTLSLTSDGSGTSGLGTTNLNAQNVGGLNGVSGNVYDYATGALKLNTTDVTNPSTAGVSLTPNGTAATSYTLNLGHQLVGAGTGNTITGAFNALNLGLLDFSDILKNATWSGFTSTGSLTLTNNLSGFTDLTGGVGESVLQYVTGSSLAVGNFIGSALLTYHGENVLISNGSTGTYVGGDQTITLNFTGDVYDQAIPEPGMLWLFGSAGLAWFATNRKKAVKA